MKNKKKPLLLALLISHVLFLDILLNLEYFFPFNSTKLLKKLEVLRYILLKLALLKVTLSITETKFLIITKTVSFPFLTVLSVNHLLEHPLSETGHGLVKSMPQQVRRSSALSNY